MTITIKPIPEQYVCIQDGLKELNLDAILALSLENFYWISNAFVHTMRGIPDRLGAVLSIRDEDPVLLTCSIEETLVLDMTWITDVRTYQEFKQSPIAVIAEIMRQKGLGRGRIGIEKEYIVARFYDELKKELPEIELVDVSSLFRKMRMVKTQREIDILSNAAFETEKAITTSFWEAKPGDREVDVLNNMIIKTLQAGGASASGSFGSGPKSAIAHPIADKSPLKKGNIVSCDFVASFEGYSADIGRTAVVGGYNERQNHIYTSLYDVQRYLIEMVRPGVRACDIYFKAIELLLAAGIDLSLSHVGHGIGIGLHEEPLLSPICEQPLLENMIINIEPFFVTDAGYHSEDTMLVTKDGAKILSTFADHSKIICITDKK